jgi:hypothetical protein
MCFDRRVTGLDLKAKGVKEFEVLLESEEVFGAIVPGECGGDLSLGGLTTVVTMSSKPAGVGFSSHDISQNPHASDARNISDHEMELKVHLHESLLHALDVGCRTLDEGLSMAKIAAQDGDGCFRPKTSAEQPHSV